MPTDMNGFKVRTDGGVVVLDGAQKATAYVAIGFAGCPTERQTEDFADGTPVSEVEESMKELADVLLVNSGVEYGWYVGEDGDAG